RGTPKWSLAPANSTEFRAELLGNLNEGLRRRCFRFGNNDRNAFVTGNANFGEEWNFTEERNPLAVGLGMAAAMAEDFEAFPGGSHEVAHVLDDAEDRHVDFFEHGDAFSHHAE